MLKFHPLKVAALHPDADDSIALSLEVPPELHGEYTGVPGQHVVLRMELEGEETRRTYSLINAPGEWPLRIVARIHPKGRMSRHLAEHVKAGDPIDVLPPNGSLTPRAGYDSGPGRLFVAFASGSGITPVLPVVRSLLQAHQANRVILFYGNSATARAMCLEELLALKDRYLERLAVHFVMSRESQEVELYNGRLDGSRVKELARALFTAGDVVEYFICGPGDMIEQVSGALRALSVSPERIHSEHFTVASDAATVSEVANGVKVAEPTADQAVVSILMDGRRRTFNMRMNEDTVLDAATRAGLELPFSCRAGVCSTCRTKVVSGEVEMAQNYALEDWELEQGYVLACQARVKTATLELDYDEK